MHHRHRWLIGILVTCTLALALIAPAERPSLAADGIIYVDADAPGPTHDGDSWATAFTVLQPALEAAAAGAQIWVAAGTYKPSVEHGGSGERYWSFQMINGVALYGGFDPDTGDTEWVDRDWANNETVLSGDLNGDDGPEFANRDDNSYHVFYHPSEYTDLNTTAILDGFTITAGNANGASTHYFGGGMYNHGSSPTLSNVTLEDNSAGLGGGMHNTESSAPTLTDCAFAGNSASYGGGMSNYYSSPALTGCAFSTNSADYGGGIYNNYYSAPELIGCTFTGNSASYDGAGMHNDYDSTPALTDCTFTGNSADRSGGGICNDGASPTLTGCTFSGNTAGTEGGGMRNTNGSSPVLLTCTFEGNSADAGGGMYNDGSSPALTNCSLAGNSANSGGGMHNDGSSPVLTNCTFQGNSAVGNGGGMRNTNDSSPTLTNCTFTGNTASHGGAVHNWASSPTLTNCILWGDTPQEMYNYDSASSPIVSYSDIKGSCEVIPWNNCGDGNINADPLFVDAAAGDLRLQLTSPCIDAGNNAAPYLPAHDFEDDPRILDGEGDGEPRVDMGIDEVWGPPPPVIFVDLEAAGTNSGTSWANAFTELQHALTWAQEGVEIWVAEGTYEPTQEFAPGDPRSASFQMVNGVSIYGGFDPTVGHTEWEDRDWVNNVTVLSGDIGTQGDDSDNSYHVFYHPAGTNLNATAILDGFTISGGNANGLVWPHYYGGGMYNTGSSPALGNVAFSGNSATQGGGGMYNNTSSPLLTNCTFAGNSAGFAGGIYNNTASPVLTNCTFAGNTAGYYSGGILNQISSPVLTNCILWGDASPEIFNFDDGSSPLISYSDIQGSCESMPWNDCGTGNVNANPLFVDADNGDFHLGPGSPCIDAGNNDAPHLPEVDFEGDARVLDGDGNVTAIVDMGVDEVAIDWPYFYVYLPLVLRMY